MNDRQRQFCLNYSQNPNASEAARLAGYSDRTAYSIGQRLLKNVEIMEYLQELQAAADAEKIAGIDEVKAFWTSTMRDDTERIENRLRASELLAKSGGVFLQKVEVSAEIEAEIEEQNDVIIYLPDNHRPINCQEIMDEICGQ